jgi:hypothetical protein
MTVYLEKQHGNTAADAKQSRTPGNKEKWKPLTQVV